MGNHGRTGKCHDTPTSAWIAFLLNIIIYGWWVRVTPQLEGYCCASLNKHHHYWQSLTIIQHKNEHNPPLRTILHHVFFASVVRITSLGIMAHHHGPPSWATMAPLTGAPLLSREAWNAQGVRPCLWASCRIRSMDARTHSSLQSRSHREWQSSHCWSWGSNSPEKISDHEIWYCGRPVMKWSISMHHPRSCEHPPC